MPLHYSEEDETNNDKYAQEFRKYLKMLANKFKFGIISVNSLPPPPPPTDLNPPTS